MSEEINNKKRPYSNYTWVVVVALLALAFAILQWVFNANNEIFKGDQKIIFIFASLLGGYLLYSLVYNFGKLFFGKIAKMNFLSMNLIFVEFKKENGKIKFDFATPEGWSGNVHMVPSSSDYEKVKPVLFHFGGLIAYAIVAVLSSVICYFIDPEKLFYIALCVACVGILVLSVNLLPFYTDGVNDGFAIRLLLNPNNKKAYLDNSLQYAALAYNQGKLMEVRYENYDDIFQAESLIYQYYFHMNNENYNEAKKVVELMLANEEYLTLDSRCLAYNAKLYFMLLEESDETCYDYYYSLDKNYRNFAISKDSLECFKTGILIASKVEKSYEIYEYLTTRYNKSVSQYYPSRAKQELKLIKKSISLAEEKHPDWKNEE